MNRLFGRAKPKEPSPSITDCIAGVSVFNLKKQVDNSIYVVIFYILLIIFI